MSTAAKVSRDGRGRVSFSEYTIGFVQPRSFATSKAYAADYWQFRVLGRRGWQGMYDTRRDAVAALLEDRHAFIADIEAATQ